MRQLMLWVLQLWMLLCGLHAEAQVYAQMKVNDSHKRYPKITEVEFDGAEPARATYDAIYGHGVMWESEYMAFRIYMDYRQSIDLYGKKRAQLELDSTNFYSNAEWMKKGYGEDVLWVGQSVGAGSFRGWREGKAVYVDTVKARGQRVVENGPQRVVVEVWDTDWQINGKTLQMKQRYTMEAGHRDVLVDIYLEGASDKDVFATGAQKLEMDNQGFMQPDGLVGSWGRNIPEKGHPEFIEGVGIGVRVPKKYLVEVKEDEYSYLCLVHPVKGHIQYRLAACADMEESGGFHDGHSWFEWLRKNLK